MRSIVTLDHYSVLRVRRDASESEIDLAYQRAVRQQSQGLGGWLAGLLGRDGASIELAYSVLIDPQQRRAHNTWLKRQEIDLPLPPM